MKALTVRQPFAWAIARRHKLIENRSWPPPDSVVGQTIAIHAAAADPEWDDWKFVSRAIGRDAPDEYECGRIVALARVACVVKRKSELAPDQRAWWIGPYAWVLDRIRPIEPIVCKGQLRLWKVPASVLRRIPA